MKLILIKAKIKNDLTKLDVETYHESLCISTF